MISLSVAIIPQVSAQPPAGQHLDDGRWVVGTAVQCVRGGLKMIADTFVKLFNTVGWAISHTVHFVEVESAHYSRSTVIGGCVCFPPLSVCCVVGTVE